MKFFNIPVEVSDKEFLNLCSLYGKVEGEVGREKVTINNSKLGSFKLVSATRFVHMKIDPGKKFTNYYWMEGPLPGDQGRCVTVSHYNQIQQCSFCLQTADTGCLGFGQGKKCEENGGTREKMSVYMKNLKNDIGYVSLKEQYALEMAKLYNKLEGNINVTTPEDMDKYVTENWDEIEEDIGKPDKNENNKTEEKEHVEDLEKKVEEMVKEIPELQKEIKSTSGKINNSRNIVEDQLKNLIENESKDEKLIDITTKIYSSLFTEDDFTIDEEGALKVSKGTFLDNLKVKNSDMEQNPTLKLIIERMAEHFSSTVVKRARRLSLSVKRQKPADFEPVSQRQKRDSEYFDP